MAEATVDGTISAAPSPGRVLCVDDEELILKSLQRCLRPLGFDVRTATSGAAALAMLETEAVDVLVSDMRMPHMSGAELLAEVATRWPDTVRILLTGYADLDSAIAAINEGGVSAYLAKPWDDARLRQVVGESVERARLRVENLRLVELTRQQNAELAELNRGLEARVAERTADLQGVMDALFENMEELKRGHTKMVSVVAALAALRDPAGRDVANLRAPLAVETARAVGVAGDDLLAIEDAARLLSIGQLGLADELLAKPRSQWRDVERRRFESHPLLAEATLHDIADLAAAGALIRAQHEHLDGSGFPDRLGGDSIPIGARVLCVVRDYFDLLRGAVTGKVMAASEARDAIVRRAGSWYDKRVVEAFVVAVARHDTAEASGLEVRIPVGQLRSGMTLARDLVTTDGQMLLSRSQPITELLLKRLIGLVERTGVELVVYVTRSSITRG